VVVAETARAGLRSAVKCFLTIRDIVPAVYVSAKQLAAIANLDAWFEVSMSKLRENATAIEF
jgi:hypothetical protein